MIELVFIACLKTAPDQCEEHALRFIANPSPVYCMIEAPPHLAIWSAEHPGLLVKNWKCQAPGQREIRT